MWGGAVLLCARCHWQPNGNLSWTQQFTYDQLNRITSSTSVGKTSANAFKTTYSFDANGNILAMQRYNEAGAKYDQLSYVYENTTNGYKINRNRLQAIVDDPSLTDVMKDPVTNNTNIDFENTNLDQYSYDEIGQLVADNAKEIAEVQWNIQGKPTAFIRTATSTKPDVYFSYDAHGNKISRTLVPKTGPAETTYYVRDAQGNIMAEYKGTDTEHHIYGSKRLGSVKNNVTDYDLTDHLGNVRTTVSDANQVVFAADYLPYGRIAKKFNKSEFGYNGKEYDEDLGLQDYGARWYDENGRFVSIDQKVSEFADKSGYHALGNNPIIIVDPDGKENIVVVGAQHEQGAANKLMFVNQAIKGMIEMKEKAPKESLSMVIFTEGYTPKQLEEISKVVGEMGGTLVQVNSAKELVNYINSKSTTNSNLSDPRKNDKVTNMEIYSHGLVGTIEFGHEMGDDYAEKARFNKSHANSLNKGAFKGLDSKITSNACRTGSGNKEIDWVKLPFESDMQDQSLAQSMANGSGALVNAYLRRTSYVGTLGNASDRNLPNNPFIKLPTLYKLPAQKTVDGAVFTPGGASRGVTPGTSPVGTDPNMQTYKPQGK